MKVLRYYSVSLGCPKNRVDTEHLLGSLAIKLEPTPHLGRAQLIFVNTCGFILPAVEESVRTIVEIIHHLSRLKRRPLLVVGGCLVGRYGIESLAKDLPEVDLWLANSSIPTWPLQLVRALGFKEDLIQTKRLLSTPKSYAWLKVSDGCRHACSFCTIPSIRGRHRSIPAKTLVNEAKELLAQGVKELVLVAQDVSAWGEDFNLNLRHLLEELLPLQGLRWLRLMYLYPAGLTDDLLSFMQEATQNGPLLPYFDIPLQHAHEDILKRMGRPFTKNPYQVVERVRQAIPRAVLRSSFIVGFPGEEEKHFKALESFILQCRLHHVGVFSFSPEEGTKAALMPEQIKDGIKEERREHLMNLQHEISEEIIAEEVNKDHFVLVDQEHGEWPGLYVGRVWFQAPEVDGITYISGPNVSIGNMVQGQVVESSNYDLTVLT